MLQATAADSFLIVQRLFDELQGSLAAGEQPSGRARELRPLLESQVFFEHTDATFDPALWSDSYIPGESTFEELVLSTGFLSVDDFVDAAMLGIGLFDESLDLPEGMNLDVQLELECQSFDISAVDALCEQRGRDPLDFACRSVERIPDRDSEIIASVCEELPYFLVCQPDNPPPMTYEEATGQPKPE